MPRSQNNVLQPTLHPDMAEKAMLIDIADVKFYLLEAC